jgi:homocysteine S-methyltransferase
VQLAREARDQLEGPHAARIAGAISPLADCLRPDDSPGSAAGPEHRTIAVQLAEAGCDILLAETFGRVDEARAAVVAAQDLGRPVWLAVVARADGHLLAGETFNNLIAALADLELGALLINCTDLQHLAAAVPNLLGAAAARPDLLLGAYPHTGHAHATLGWQTHATDAATFAAQLAALVTTYPQLSLVGACCGSTPAWISALAGAPPRDPRSPRRRIHAPHSSARSLISAVTAMPRTSRTCSNSRRPRLHASSFWRSAPSA